MKSRKIEMAGKVLLAISIAFAFPLFEVLLPIERFAFRAWEPMLLRRPGLLIPGLFYPNKKIEMNEVGDLAPYTNQQVPHQTTWITDQFGYRNSEPCPDPAVILMGDSMASGIGLDQSEMISEVIAKETGICTYSFGHEGLESTLEASARWNWKPKFAVMVLVERNISQLQDFPSAESIAKARATRFLFQEKGLASLVAVFERMQGSNFHPYRDKHGIVEALRRAILGQKLFSASLENQKMLFFQKEQALAPTGNTALRGYLKFLSTYKREFAKMGMEFILVVVPNKESIYPELIPSTRRADLLPKLYQGLNEEGISYIDLFHPYRSAFQASGKIYYHLDDTHWNADGTSLAAKKISEVIKSSSFSK